jgi:hypothetical protein
MKPIQLALFDFVLLCSALRALAQQSGNFAYTTNNGTIAIAGYFGPGGTVAIPSSLNGLAVSSIGDHAFWGCSATNLTIPDSITNIGNQAFAYSSRLASVTFGSGVASIGEEAFSFCGRLTSISLSDSVITIGTNAFSYCANLMKVAIPRSVANLGSAAFAGCSNLTVFTVDALNPSFSSLNGILFDKNQTMLIQCPPGAIAGSYSIPHTVASLADYAFMYCMALTEVIIPKGVTNIGDYAFYCCTNLSDVFFQGNAPSYADLSFATQAATTFYYLPDTLGWEREVFASPPLLWNPKAQPPGVRGNLFGFDVKGTANIPILVEACTNLANSAWVPVQIGTLTNGLVHFIDPQWTNHPARFYRIRSP